MINSLSFCPSKNIFPSPSLMKDISAGNRLLIWLFFFFLWHFKNIFPLFLSFHNCAQKLAISYIIGPLKVMSFFSSQLLLRVSLGLYFKSSIKICPSVLYPVRGLLNYVNLWTDTFISFGKCLTIIFSNICSMLMTLLYFCLQLHIMWLFISILHVY